MREFLYQGGVPIVLSASNTIASGSTAIADAGRLQNTSRSPMVIEEVRFIARSADMASAAVADMGGVIRAKLQLGRDIVSQDFIPLWNYCAAPQLAAQTVEGFASEVLNNNATYSFQRWRLAVPLLVAPGEVMTCQYSRDVDSGMPAGSATVEVAYAGRVLPHSVKMPRIREVPYISMFRPAENVGTAISNDIHLGNPFHQPLTVNQITGRIMQQSANYDSWATNNGIGIANTVFMKMYTQDGHNMIRDFTPFHHAIEINHLAWSINHRMGPRESIRVQLSGISAYTAPTVDARDSTVSIAAIGWRKERV